MEIHIRIYFSFPYEKIFKLVLGFISVTANSKHVNIMEIKDNELLRQFEWQAEHGLLSVEYSLQERQIFLTSISSQDEKDAPKSNDFLVGILELLKEKRLRVVPTHPLIVSFFRKNPTYKEMLPPGIRI